MITVHNGVAFTHTGDLYLESATRNGVEIDPDEAIDLFDEVPEELFDETLAESQAYKPLGDDLAAIKAEFGEEAEDFYGEFG